MSRTVPVVTIENPGVIVASALWNSGPKAMGDFYLSPPIFRGHQSSTQSTSSGVWTPMNLNVTDVDSESGHSNVTNNSRYTCQVPGVYLVEGFAAWTNLGASAAIGCGIALNGTLIQGANQFVRKQNIDLSSVSASCLVFLKVNDYIEVWGNQNTGGALNTTAGTDLDPCMNAIWVHS